MHPSPFEIINSVNCFSQFELCFETKAAYSFFIFYHIKLLRAIVTLFFSNFFQSSFSDG